MHDIKIKVKPQDTIKNINKSIIGVQKIKNNLVTTKEKINEITIDDDNNSGEEYAGRKVQNEISYATRKGIEEGNEIGKKSLKETQQNFIKGKQKVNAFKSRIKEKRVKELKNVINNTNKTIKSGTKKTIKTAKGSTKLTGKSIKIAERVAKNSQKVAKESVKATQRAIKITKHAVKVAAKTIKVTVQATIKAIKAIAAGVKALISAIVAGGWIAVFIILVIVLIAGFIAVIFNSDGDTDYDGLQIPNSEILLCSVTIDVKQKRNENK